MKIARIFQRVVLATAALTCALVAGEGRAGQFVFNGAPDNEIDALGYYYAITGGQFPTGTTPNGSRASGGTFRRIYDDPYWGASIDTWLTDGWFPENAGLALTLYNGATNIYDNNGIDTGTQGTYYET